MRECAIAIIFNEEKDQIVLVKRRDVDVWVLPGGGIDAGETPAEAAIREAFEETGLIVEVVRQVAEYTPINRLASQTYTYECMQTGGNLTGGDESRAVKYFTLDELPEGFFFIHKEWLQDALKGSSNVIYKPLTRVTYWEVLKYFLRHPGQVLRTLCSRIGFPINTKKL